MLAFNAPVFEALHRTNISSSMSESFSPQQSTTTSSSSSLTTSSRSSRTCSSQSTAGTTLLSQQQPSTKSSTPTTPSSHSRGGVDDHPELEEMANEWIATAYNLVWERQDYVRARVILLKVLELQQSLWGKHHLDVGYTCNFIATTYWLEGVDLNSAMRYFLEARRIVCKNDHKNRSLSSHEEEDDDVDGVRNENDASLQPHSRRLTTTGPLLRGIDDRIHCILIKFGLPESEIQRAKRAIERTIAHETYGDRLKEQGFSEAAKEQYRNARKVAGVLRLLM